MSEWNEILERAEEWKEKDGKLDQKFAKCIYGICIRWYKMTESQKKIYVTLATLILMLFAMLMFYDFGYAFGKFLYNIGI